MSKHDTHANRIYVALLVVAAFHSLPRWKAPGLREGSSTGGQVIFVIVEQVERMLLLKKLLSDVGGKN